MRQQDGQLLGMKVLAKIDLLIEVISIIGKNKNGEKEDYFLQGCDLVKELRQLLVQMIGPRDDYIKDAIEELIIQRLPDKDMLSSLDVDLSELLDGMYDRDKPSSLKAVKRVEARDEDPLRKAINYLFPQYKVINNYRKLGCLFKYYIPSLKLAIDKIEEGSSDSVRKEYICRQSGINFVAIPVKEMSCSREMIKKIKRTLDMNKTLMLE
ncbi:MAG: hypothetical protein ACN4A7_02620 [Thermacetogeniaceae bacterium]|nr:hypothetical protein [Thermoanaerobacterales bacterium]NLN20758.1 hypothetical protein [Syntrophomonadaceae bacterium]